MSHSSRFSQRAPSTLKGARLVPSARTTNLILHYTATKKPFMYSFFLELRGLSPNFHSHVSVSDLYILKIGPHISSRRIGRSTVGIYKYLTDTHECGNWDWGSSLPFWGIFVSICRYWFFAVYTLDLTYRVTICTVHMEAKSQFRHDCMEENK